MIGSRRPPSSRKVGDRRVRVERPHSAYFRYAGPGQLTAKATASVPTTRLGTPRVIIPVLGRDHTVVLDVPDRRPSHARGAAGDTG